MIIYDIILNFELGGKQNFNYFQLLYRELKGILLYQGFPRPILPTNHPEQGMVEGIYKSSGILFS